MKMISIRSISTVACACFFLVLPAAAFAVGSAADTNPANTSGTGGCNPEGKFDPNIPKGQTDNKGLAGLIGLGCVDPTTGAPGKCTAADVCKGTVPQGTPTPQQLQQESSANASGEQGQGAAQNTESAQASGDSGTAALAGSTQTGSAGNSNAANSENAAAQPQNAGSQSLLQSAIDQYMGGNPNPFGSNGASAEPNGPAWVSNAQVSLQPADIGQPNSAGPTGQATAPYESGSPGFSSLASQPMGSLTGLTNDQIQAENSLGNTPGTQLNAQDYQATLQNQNGAAQTAADYLQSTQPADVRATIYTPGAGGDNGGLYGSHSNYLNPNVPTVAAGFNSGLTYGEVVNVFNPNTNQSINAVVGDTCPACGTGVDLTPVTAQSVGLSMEQGTTQMLVSVVGNTGSYEAGAQLAASLNSPSTWTSATSAQFPESISSAASVVPGPSIQAFPGGASALAYVDSNAFTDGTYQSYEAGQPYQTASGLSAQASTVVASAETMLEPAQTPASFQPVTSASSPAAGGLSGGAVAELNPTSVLSQPILTDALANAEAAPIGQVTNSELADIPQTAESGSASAGSGPEAAAGQIAEAPAAQVENAPEALQTTYPVAPVEAGLQLEQPNPAIPVQSGLELSQPSPVVPVESQPIASIESAPAAPAESGSISGGSDPQAVVGQSAEAPAQQTQTNSYDSLVPQNPSLSQLPQWADTVVADAQNVSNTIGGWTSNLQALADQYAGVVNFENPSAAPTELATSPGFGGGSSNEQASYLTSAPSGQGYGGGSPAQETTNSPQTNYENPSGPLAKQNPSIVDYLNATGQDFSYAARRALAAASGITNYVGSAAQNLQLLSILRGF